MRRTKLSRLAGRLALSAAGSMLVLTAPAAADAPANESANATAQTIVQSPAKNSAAKKDANHRPTQVADNAPAKPAGTAASGTESGAVRTADNQAAPAALSDQSELETIVVTARHRSENVDKVPIAISVVSGDQLKASNIFNLSQVTSLVPSLQIQGINPRNQTVSIRGLGSNPGLTTEGFEPGVGIYVDGVYYARPASVLFDQFDLDRVEVLRGPQGTLFGKNTTAGAISVTTNAPSFETGVEGEVSYGNYNFRQIDGAITGALTDDLAARLTLGDTSRNDFITATNPNEASSGLHNQSARVQFLYTPLDSLSIKFSADYNYQYFQGPHQVISSVLPRTLANGSTVQNFYDHGANVGYYPQPPIATDAFARESDINSPNFWKQWSYGGSLQVDWTAPNDSWLGADTLTSITAYREFTLYPKYDSDYSGVNYYSSLYVHIKQMQWSQEFRVASPTDQVIDYTGGVYVFWQNSPVDSHSIFADQAAQFLYGAATSPLVLNGLDNHSHFKADDGSYSAYGQATWHITHEISLQAGLRYTYEDKYGYNITAPAGTYAPISALPPAQQATAVTRRATNAPTYDYATRWAGGNLSGTTSLNYQPTDDILTYATYSRGFQSAGLNLAGVPSNIPKVVDPETVDSYEVGAKTQWFDNRLSLNADVFLTRVYDFQATINDRSLGGTSYIANGGSVRSRGVEVDVRAVPLEGLSLSISGVYDDAIYTSLSSTPCPYLYSYIKTGCNLTGSPLAGASRWAGSATAEYAHGIGNGEREAYIGGDYTARSSFFGQLNDDPFSEVPGYGLLSLHVGVRSVEGWWDVSVWGRNVLNQDYYTVLGPSSAFGYVTAALGDPRTFGVTLRGKF